MTRLEDPTSFLRNFKGLAFSGFLGKMAQEFYRSGCNIATYSSDKDNWHFCFKFDIPEVDGVYNISYSPSTEKYGVCEMRYEGDFILSSSHLFARWRSWMSFESIKKVIVENNKTRNSVRRFHDLDSFVTYGRPKSFTIFMNDHMDFNPFARTVL